MHDEYEHTGYSLTATPHVVVYTLYAPETRNPLLQLQFTPEQAEHLGSDLILAAASTRMQQGDKQTGEA
jgi:hypothetical protein